MARAGVLYSQVARAAASLTADGKNPTVDTVRAAMGGTGSKSTIGPMLKQWKADHEGQTVATSAGLPADLLETVKTLYQRLQADAQVQVEQLRSAHEQALQQATQLLETERAQGRQLQAERNALTTELSQSKEALKHERDERQHAAVTIAAQQAEKEGLAQRLADRAAEVKLLADQLAQARQQFDHFQQAAAHQRDTDRQAGESRIATLEHELGATRTWLQEHREALGVLRAERAHGEERLTILTSTVKDQAASLTVAGQGLIDARERATSHQHSAEIAELRLREAERSIVELKSGSMVIAEENSALRGLVTAFMPAPAGLTKR